MNNQLKITFRNMFRNKVYSFINIFGLAVGLCTCMLIMLFIADECSYDKQFKDADRIYRVSLSLLNGKENDKWASQAAPLAWALKSELPAVEQVTRLLKFPNMDQVLLQYENKKDIRRFYESNGYYVDSTFFQVFEYPFKYGNEVTALHEPNSIVISETLSKKLFGNENPVGKAIKAGLPFGDFYYTVTGVFEDEKVKSHIPANYLLSMKNGDIGQWVNSNTNWTMNKIFHTYVKLRPGTDTHVFEKSLNQLNDRHAGADLKTMGVAVHLFLQPLTDIYLHSQIGNEIGTNGNLSYLYILGSIAGFILFIACINFMNLSTAKSQKRAREVGVRKVLGASRVTLIRQFLSESFIISSIAFAIATVLAFLLLPGLNHLIQKELVMNPSPGWILLLVGLLAITGTLAGLYPAFYLSSFKPASVLKGKILNKLSAISIRKGLVVFQFTISICLIFAVLVIWKQLNLFRNKDLGFAKEQQLILPMQGKMVAMNYTLLKSELIQNPAVKSMTSGSSYPGITNINDMLFYAEGKPRSEFVDLSMISMEKDYLKTLGLKLLEGRLIGELNESSDSANLIINETAVKQLGYDIHSVVGKKIYFDYEGTHYTREIAGVVKDFNFESLYNPIKPLGFSVSNFFGNKYNYAVVNLQTGDLRKLISDIEKTWDRINPSAPFIYTFLDQDFARNYEKEEKISRMTIYFMIVAIVIACLGLFGLSAFSAEYRTKEIGVRKVLGASVRSVTVLLSFEFVQLVVLAIFIALPLAGYFMNKWLEDFAYQTSMNWWMYAIAGIAAIIIALITVSFHSFKAAIANPAESLQTQ